MRKAGCLGNTTNELAANEMTHTYSQSCRWGGAARRGKNKRYTGHLAYGDLAREFFRSLIGEKEVNSGFSIVSEIHLDVSAYESANPLLRYERATAAIAAAKATDDPAEMYLLSQAEYRRRMRELRLTAYRMAHQPRRERPTKLTFQQCEQIKRQLSNGASRKRLAAEYGVSVQYIANLANGEKRTNWGTCVTGDGNQQPMSDAVDPVGVGGQEGPTRV